MEIQHQPVLLGETLEALALEPNQTVIDATVGSGGHAEGILEKTAPRGMLLGLDRDPEAIERARVRLSRFGDRAMLVRSPFGELARVAASSSARPQAILFDLGVSMDQLKDPARGFSLSEPGPLDMRMDPWQALTAAAILKTWKTETVTQLLSNFDEPLASVIAKMIAITRAKRSIETTTDLADLVSEVYQRRFKDKSRRHPATRTFLALRAAVNDELGQLQRGLKSSLELLPSGGRLAVISFHSGEDRLVKLQLRAWALGCTAKTHEPGCNALHKPRVDIPSRQPLAASRAEVTTNPASRSARLRWAVKR